MFINYIVGLSAILDIGVLKRWGNPVWILFKLCIYLYFISQVKDYYIQMWEGEATH